MMRADSEGLVDSSGAPISHKDHVPNPMLSAEFRRCAVVYTGAVVDAGIVVYTGALLHTADVVYAGAV
eukprot:8800992-Pyramimonas_sp.AAC.1